MNLPKIIDSYNLTEADLEKIAIGFRDMDSLLCLNNLYIRGSIHTVSFYFGAEEYYDYSRPICIGCELHPMNYWLENYKKIGNYHNYSETEIQEYYKYLLFCKNLSEDIKGRGEG